MYFQKGHFKLVNLLAETIVTKPMATKYEPQWGGNCRQQYLSRSILDCSTDSREIKPCRERTETVAMIGACLL